MENFLIGILMAIFKFICWITFKIASWFFAPYVSMMKYPQVYTLTGSFWHNFFMLFPAIWHLILFLAIMLLIAKNFKGSFDNRELGSITYKIMFFIILITALCALRMNLLDDTIISLLSLVAYRWAGDLLRAVKIWNY